MEYLTGKSIWNLNNKPLLVFDGRVINFINDLSKSILNEKSNRDFSDLISFGFWCRKSNLNRIINIHKSQFTRVGRGIAFHIAPGNMPVNFAFSIIFSLLCGNLNIVRLPQKKHAQTTIICNTINSLLKLEKYKFLTEFINIISYERDKELTREISLISDCRIIWGSDQTISEIRKFDTNPRTVDLLFPDRYSMSILEASAIKETNKDDLKKLANNFYNDTLLFDQNACSSPHLIFWKGNYLDVKKCQSVFWENMEEITSQKSSLEKDNKTLEKYLTLCKFVSDKKLNSNFNKNSKTIYRLELKELSNDIDQYKGKFGFFLEYQNNNIDKIENIINKKYQTITYYGNLKKEIMEIIVKNGIRGVDRIVPIGNALEIGTIWDGYDIITNLTRIIT